MQEISKQVTESMANSICNYGSEDDVPLNDALLVNYIAESKETSLWKIFSPEKIPMTNNEPNVSEHVDAYLEEIDGDLQILIAYQKKAS